MTEIAQSEQDAWLNFSKGLVHFENSTFQSVFENGFKAGFDCRDKLDNEALKVAFKALNMINSHQNCRDSFDICKESLAKIRELIGEK